MAPEAGHRPEVASALFAAAIGGAVGWIASFAGLRVWGLLIGFSVSLALLLALARRSGADRSFPVMAAFGFAFALLTWPLLWLLIGLIRFAITGHSLGA